MRRSRYHVNTKKNSTFALNITSMTDMFTIILVFLLQTYASTTVQVETDPGLRLPSSSSELSPTFVAQLQLTEDKLILDQKELVSLKEKAFLTSDLDKNDHSFIVPLFKELHRMHQEKLEAKGNTNPNDKAEPGELMLLADRSLTYETVKKVMYTASMAGFPKVKLATTLGN